MIVPLQAAYRCRDGQPVLDRVDLAIFRTTYFAACMDCTFCQDRCCWHGADIDLETQARLHAVADDLENYLDLPREQWLEDAVRSDAEFPGGQVTRTRAVAGRCVFLNRDGRGCRLHGYSLDRGLDFHRLKPMVCSLFPLTFHDGLLLPADEVRDSSLVCLGEGDSLYRAARNDLGYYFGDGLIAELDSLARS